MLQFKASKISDRVYWVGAIDWGIRDFHGYLTARGTTYNAFLVMGDKIALIDTVKPGFRDELLARVSSVIDPTKIDYIVSNHAEMDHSGCLPEIYGIVKPDKVFASTMGAKAIQEHFGSCVPIETVGENAGLSLGNMNLSFVETRMIHWPDSMFSYLHEEKMLFSQDGFGMHLATTERFADEIPEWILDEEAAKYFANILLPLSELIKNLLGKVTKLGLPIDIIAPDHGPVWRKDPGNIVGLYSKWSEQKRSRKAVIAYDSMWGSTSLMARMIADGIVEGGGSALLMPLASCHRSDIATEVLDCGALIVGSPTLNNGVLPRIADLLSYIKGLKPKNLIGAAFGSYGWSGESIGSIEESLKAMKIEIAAESLKCKYVPDSDVAGRCHEFGLAIGRKLAEKWS